MRRRKLERALLAGILVFSASTILFLFRGLGQDVSLMSCVAMASTSKREIEVEAQIQYDIEPLISKLSAVTKFDWIIYRLRNLWPKWVLAMRTLEQHNTLKHHRKRVLLHLGIVTKKAGRRIAETAFSGGPLGELVQWSDLIATLHLLGHEMEFSTEVEHLINHLDIRADCPKPSESRFDAVFIDLFGMWQVRSLVEKQFQHYSCLFRVLESFGLEPVYNFKRWKPDPWRKGDRGEYFGNWELQLRQYMTFFPHTPDNSFLGLIIDVDTQEGEKWDKLNQAVVYGKELYMWKGKQDYLDVINKYLEIHATVSDIESEGGERKDVPEYVVNHGILNSTSLKKLLKASRVFIGLGFPPEGPAPLEAIAHGCVFLNPQLDPPVNRENTGYFVMRPTDRELTSQHPYTQQHIGPPHVYTINMTDLPQVEKVVKEIIRREPPSPYLPFELSMEGMLQRVMVYMEHQDFCNPKQWPPLSELRVTVGSRGESCKDTCSSKGLVCEPEFFHILNTKEAIENAGLVCTSTVREHSVHGPSVNQDGGCSLQEERLLLGCVGAHEMVTRICPCRTYRPGQIALCESCV